MPLSVTALYAGILALIMLALAINVTMHRLKLGVSLGDGGNPQMLRMIRVHGNASEYIPLVLILMAIYELNGGSHMALHIIGVAIIIGRLLQSWDIFNTDVPGMGRRLGQSLTWLALAALALLNLWKLI